MLIITECKKCSKDNKTCDIKIALSGKLQEAKIKERLRYRCKNWESPFKPGQEVEFYYIERGEERGQWDESTSLKGIIQEVALGKCFIKISAEEYEARKTDHYISKYGMPMFATWDTMNEEPTSWLLPVRNEFILV